MTWTPADTLPSHADPVQCFDCEAYKSTWYRKNVKSFTSIDRVNGFWYVDCCIWRGEKRVWATGRKPTHWRELDLPDGRPV